MMKSQYLISAAAVLLFLANTGACYDIAALQETVGSLCAVNTEGIFASCCVASNNGQAITEGNIKDCFFSNIVAYSDGTIAMFVDPLVSCGHGSSSSTRHTPAPHKSPPRT